MKESDTGNMAIRTVQLIHSSIGLGLGLFVMIIFYTAGQGNPPTGESQEPYRLFGAIAAGLFFTNAIAADRIFRFQFRGIKLKPGEMADPSTPIKYIALFTKAHIVRLALIEGAALFAAVTLFLHAGSAGTIDLSDPVAQVPLGVIGAFYLLWIIWFPTGDRIAETIQKYL